jgi:hypothetical protein
MKPAGKLLGLALLLTTSLNAAAWMGDNGWDWNPWPVWTPMYWMEEMVGENNWNDGPYFNSPPYSAGYPTYGGYPYGSYGYPYAGYNHPYTAPPPWDYSPYYYGAPWY